MHKLLASYVDYFIMQNVWNTKVFFPVNLHCWGESIHEDEDERHLDREICKEDTGDSPRYR